MRPYPAAQRRATMRGIRFFGLTLALVGLVASACGGTTTPGATTSAAPSQTTVTKDLIIGFTASQTGAQNVTSKRQTDGIQLWVDDVTKVGGIKLKDGTVLMPKVKFYDDESKTDRVQALYTKLINDDKVDFLLSPYSSGLVKAAAVVTEQNGRLMITAGGADDVTMEQGFKGVYQVYAPGSKYLVGAIDLMLKLDPTIKKVAIVNEKDSFSASVVAAANPYAKSKGLDVVVAEGYDTGTTDFNPFINKIQAASPDAIIGGGHFEDGTTFAKQLFEKRVNARFVALLVAPPEPTFKDIGDAAQFITDRYVAKYNSQPSYQSSGGYAAGLVLQKALEDAGSTDPAKIQAALDKIDLMLFYGRVKFSLDAKTHGKQVAHDMVYVQWQKGSDGKLATQIVWPSDAATAPAQLRK
ncbi:MAG: hypothetical protein E6J09_06820 [Chloroflexi bacterium]|nr:MAG: hypothetical protein E6J09_06820 [Chloroflexota bacterium]